MRPRYSGFGKPSLVPVRKYPADIRFYTLGEREYVTMLMPEEADHIQELFSRFPNLAEGISLTKPGKKHFLLLEMLWMHWILRNR